ncbi:MAG: hypothetical protein ISS47_00755 [Candidatus Omnitrophica bacterium]|nr:hypothetical protein [Candidatus Omnitrophota bacterium]
MIFLGLFFLEKAYAYLDPGSGSYVFQLIIGILFGALFAIKIFWTKIKFFLKNLLLKFKRK